jgi:pimeloyl-ACP methyl ester carboxylesterase
VVSITAKIASMLSVRMPAPPPWQLVLDEDCAATTGVRSQGLTPRLTGLGNRVHLAHRVDGLAIHLEDVLNLLTYEGLNGVVLVGHSYGGMVVTGVADRVPERVDKLIYLDAFVPNDGQGDGGLLANTATPERRDARTHPGRRLESSGSIWRVMGTDTQEPVRSYRRVGSRLDVSATCSAPISDDDGPGAS